MTRLNLGSGIYVITDYDNLDPSFDGWTFEQGLGDYDDGSVECITIAHALMYVAIEDWPYVFAEFARVLEPGGVLRITEDSTQDPESERYGGHHDAVTLTSSAVVLTAMRAADLDASTVYPDATAFKDNTIIQNLHGEPPKVFYVEGVKPLVTVSSSLTQPTISVVVPTIGRTTLGRTLRSLKDADEVLVEYNHDGDKGYAARTRAIARAKTSHIGFCDDDDHFTQGAIGAMRQAARDWPDKVHIFKMRYGRHDKVLWNDKTVALGNLGTPMILVPNLPEKLGRWQGWGSDGCGDYRFAMESCERLGDPVWHDEIVCIVDAP